MFDVFSHKSSLKDQVIVTVFTVGSINRSRRSELFDRVADNETPRENDAKVFPLYFRDRKLAESACERRLLIPVERYSSPGGNIRKLSDVEKLEGGFARRGVTGRGAPSAPIGIIKTVKGAR